MAQLLASPSAASSYRCLLMLWTAQSTSGSTAKPLQHHVSARAPNTAETQQDTRYSASTTEREPRLLLQQQRDSCGDWRGARLCKQSPLHTCGNAREPLQKANQTCSRWEHRLWSNKVCAQAPPDRSSQLPLPKTGSVSSKAAVTMPSLH